MPFLARKIRFLPFLVPIFLSLVFFSLSSMKMRRAPWYQEAVSNLVEPPQWLASRVARSIGGAWDGYVALVGAAQERDALAARVAELEGEALRSEEVSRENERLRALLGYREGFPQRTVVARVVANDPRSEFKSITIDRGFSDGVRPLMPVIGPRGLVGKVGTVDRGSARVLLLTDPNSSVDCMVQRSRARGLAVGTAWRTELKPGFYIARMEYLRRVSDIREGDVVVTSGFDTVFPPGIPIGTVKDVSTSRYGVFTGATVVPFENMAELQEVLVVIGVETRIPARQGAEG
ncbi:MAG: rod shape-determining protein MreC [Proteobacteria bacterium]|nr:rod shape-determining protein MreC [Pseudomonadota bacterium]